MKIALLAGDGIGPEIMRECVRVPDVLRKQGLGIETAEALVGGADLWNWRVIRKPSDGVEAAA